MLAQQRARNEAELGSLRNAVQILDSPAPPVALSSYAQAAAIVAPMQADRQNAKAIRWSTLAAKGASRKRTDLPPELKQRLEQATKDLAQFHRAPAQSVQRTLNRERKVVALYFKKFVQGNPRHMKIMLQGLITPLDRGAIICVDFIGRSIVEILVDGSYKQDVIEALRLCEYRYMSKATPFWNFATKFKDTAAANEMLFNNTKLVDRTTNLLNRIDHPAARKFYSDVRDIAQSNILKAREDGADLDELALNTRRLERAPSRGRISPPPAPTNDVPASNGTDASGAPNSVSDAQPDTHAGSATGNAVQTDDNTDATPDEVVPETPEDEPMGSPNSATGGETSPKQ